MPRSEVTVNSTIRKITRSPYMILTSEKCKYVKTDKNVNSLKAEKTYNGFKDDQSFLASSTESDSPNFASTTIESIGSNSNNNNNIDGRIWDKSKIKGT